MDADSYGRLIYLVLLGAVIGGSLLLQNRHRLGAMTQQALIWGLIFAGVVVLYGLKDELRAGLFPREAIVKDNTVSVQRAADGHFYLTLAINDTPVVFVVDTGATDMVLRHQDAERVGVDTKNLAYIGTAMTANGVVRTARIRLDTVVLGNLSDQSVSARVNESEMAESLLGMSYLSRFSQLTIVGDRLTLTR